MPREPIAFRAYFHQTRQALSIDGEGEATLKLTVPASDLAGVQRALRDLRGQPFYCTLIGQGTETSGAAIKPPR
jgi:hypothetical protein